MIDPQFKLNALESAREIAESFDDPEDDFVSAAMFLGDEGDAAMVPIIFRNDEEKQILTERVLPGAAVMAKATQFAIIVSSWMVEKRDESILDVRPSEHPDRIEALVITFGSKDGTIEMWRAKLSRDGVNPPTLGEWDLTLSTRDAKITGSFIEPLMKVIKSN